MFSLRTVDKLSMVVYAADIPPPVEAELQQSNGGSHTNGVIAQETGEDMAGLTIEQKYELISRNLQVSTQ